MQIKIFKAKKKKKKEYLDNKTKPQIVKTLKCNEESKPEI